MARRSEKEIITKIVYDSLPDKSIYENYTIEKISFKWFVTGRTGSGLQLTYEGYKCFTEANLTYYDFPVGHKLKDMFANPTVLAMNLNKHIKCPYYMSVERQDNKPVVFIRLYDNKIAMMVTLYGTIEEYLQSQIK